MNILHKIRIIIKAKKKYKRDRLEYNELVNLKGGIGITKENGQLYDYISPAGNVDSHYFIQDIYVANKIMISNIEKHYDIGSRVDGFISHLLSNPSIKEVVMLDIRPLPYDIERLHFLQADATELVSINDDSIESLSCLHAIEHFGLGRYGDKIDPNACFKAMKAMKRVLKVGGKLYLSCPITMQDECHFNAHRIFSPKTILKEFEGLNLVEFAFIHDMNIVSYKDEEAINIIENEKYHLGEYDCGIFIFRK